MNGARGSQHLLAVSLLAAALAVAVPLLPTVLPLPWFAALAAPALLFGHWLRHRTARWPIWLVMIALQMLLVAAAITATDILSPPAALAGSIVPPLLFVTARHRRGDGELGLFLAFCLLLVGAILIDIGWPLLTVYAFATGMALRASARLQVLKLAAPTTRTSSPNAPRQTLPRQFATALPLAALACLLAYLLTHAFTLLPAATRVATPSERDTAADQHHPGLAEDFEPGGEKSDIRRETGRPLLYVRAGDGEDLPVDLYLRSGYFDVPGLDRWRTATTAALPSRDTTVQAFEPHPPVADVDLHHLTATRLATAGNLVFVPPGTTRLQGLANLRTDVDAEYCRQPEGATPETYGLWYQDLREAVVGHPIDERFNTTLLALPGELDVARLRTLLAQLVPADLPPNRLPDQLISALWKRCRYSLQGPSGSDGHVLYDFLFGTARQGSCMHFAAALATLLRVAGVPCRIAVGLQGGDVDDNDERARVFAEHHAHAWVEVPFEGLGFVLFDPTPLALRRNLLTARNPDGEPPADLAAGPDRATAKPDVAPAATPSSFANLLATARRLLASPWPWTVLLACVVAINLRPTRTRSRQPALPRALRPARKLLADLLRELAHHGWPRRHGDTLEQHAAALMAITDRTTGATIADAFAAYQEVRFGGRPFDASRKARMQAALRLAPSLQR